MHTFGLTAALRPRFLVGISLSLSLSLSLPSLTHSLTRWNPSAQCDLSVATSTVQYNCTVAVLEYRYVLGIQIYGNLTYIIIYYISTNKIFVQYKYRTQYEYSSTVAIIPSLTD